MHDGTRAHKPYTLIQPFLQRQSAHARSAQCLWHFTFCVVSFATHDTTQTMFSLFVCSCVYRQPSTSNLRRSNKTPSAFSFFFFRACPLSFENYFRVHFKCHTPSCQTMHCKHACGMCFVHFLLQSRRNALRFSICASACGGVTRMARTLPRTRSVKLICSAGTRAPLRNLVQRKETFNPFFLFLFLL